VAWDHGGMAGAVAGGGLAGVGGVRVATLNLWGRSGAWAGRRSVLVEGFRELRPDLVAFQESIVTGGDDQVAELLGGGFQLVHQRARAADGMGVSIASRWPLRGVRELDLHVTPRTAGFPCVTLMAEVAVPEPVGPLLFVNPFPSWQPAFEHERALQAVVAARPIEELAGRGGLHVVLAGDLDADPEAASVRFWSGRQALDGTSVCYRDAWERVHPGEPGETFTPSNPLVVDRDWPFRRIDYVFVRCGDHGGPTLEVAGCGRIFDRPVGGVWASDHFGVVADLVAPAAGS
jgi:endonuclease/exonuclease/phosphatase family metal-dependent hydrolase